MRKGFVAGKFMPLHEGHLALIEFAQQHCDRLYIILCFTDNEPIDGLIRKHWLQYQFAASENIEVLSFFYDERILPNTSVSSEDASRVWAIELKKLVPDADIVFSSEKYGNYLANFMDIEHMLFDEQRKQVPIAASQILEDPFKYWEFIPMTVQPYYVKKVVLLGSESTGKSILAGKLAAHFNTIFVAESARDIIDKTGECLYDDLHRIAILHAQRINTAAENSNRILFIDTDINITRSYSRFLFGKELLVEPWIEAANTADLYLFLEPDCDFVQDGTRLEENDRNKLSLSHTAELEQRNINFVSIGGNWQERFDKAVSIIKQKYFA